MPWMISGHHYGKIEPLRKHLALFETHPYNN